MIDDSHDISGIYANGDTSNMVDNSFRNDFLKQSKLEISVAEDFENEQESI
jgi:hypothetical protein